MTTAANKFTFNGHASAETCIECEATFIPRGKMYVKSYGPLCSYCLPQYAKEVAKAHGEKVANCRCSETKMQGLGICKYCYDRIQMGKD